MCMYICVHVYMCVWGLGFGGGEPMLMCVSAGESQVRVGCVGWLWQKSLAHQFVDRTLGISLCVCDVRVYGK